MAIRILPQNLVNQIAAGEVVERPASALKELIENSLDAGATIIDIVAKDGGKTYLSVADNGCGMGSADLAACALRYATSKLPDDNFSSISSLGFRGEALPSIASVSRMKITTNDGSGGLCLSIDGGKAGEVRPAGMGKGTRVEVSELFYNVPARLKFLKTDRGEAAAIMDVVERMALCSPSVSFSLNDKVFAPATRRERAAQILGRDFEASCLEVGQERNGFAIEGFIGRPTYTTSTSGSQFFFVNGRSVKDKLLYSALRAAYADTMERGRFAACALWLTLPPDELDVNVHPQKAEVRFAAPDFVRASLIKCIRGAIADAPTRPQRIDINEIFGGKPTYSGELREEILSFRHLMPESRFNNPIDLDSPVGPGNDYPLGIARAQIFNKYILAECNDGLAIIDMHAAHERIVYEKLKAGAMGGRLERQILLIPEVVELGAKQATKLLDMADELVRFGLVIEPFGDGAIAVREAPAILKQAKLPEILKDLSEEEKTLALEERIAHVAKTYACHSSMRSGDAMSLAEMNELLRQIEATPNAGQCNHGRPAFVIVRLPELDRLFNR